jgi:acyl dehydratase
MGDLTAAEGRTYGPFRFDLTADRVAAYVAATGDDPDRWTDHAPPGFAAAALFHPAPAFFADPDVAPHTKSVIHADQTFVWHAPWELGSHEIVATVDRVRDRRGVAFVTFTMTVDREGERVLDSTSTFLMSGDAPPASGGEARPEPAQDERGSNEGTLRSASRADLVRYAAATTDFNPIHWDHDTAVAAGLRGVVVHGLLLEAWMLQAAYAGSEGVHPLAEAKVRFKQPVLAGAQADVAAEADGDTVDLTLSVDGEACVTGRAVTR